MNESIHNEFRFLMCEHSMTITTVGEAISFISPSINVKLSYNERDGFDARIVFPEYGSQEISIGTILGSLEKDESMKCSSWIDTMKQEALFIKMNFDKLFNLPKDLYDDCCKLYFWHTSEWRKLWGTTIRMDTKSISKENARLIRIHGYFGSNTNGNA